MDVADQARQDFEGRIHLGEGQRELRALEAGAPGRREQQRTLALRERLQRLHRRGAEAAADELHALSVEQCLGDPSAFRRVILVVVGDTFEVVGLAVDLDAASLRDFLCGLLAHEFRALTPDRCGARKWDRQSQLNGLLGLCSAGGHQDAKRCSQCERLHLGHNRHIISFTFLSAFEPRPFFKSWPFRAPRTSVVRFLLHRNPGPRAARPNAHPASAPDDGQRP
ncbi:hypothetical protein GALL_518010 [mine drainage metagenome]|uniref:Uncharacterized protein n=1 Tax=mine drainage metagenome TaxID=410659 RepID=A0A1J5PGE7_9ZZZZ